MVVAWNGVPATTTTDQAHRNDTTSIEVQDLVSGQFRHEAMLYASDDDFLAGTLPLIEEALASGDPALVMVGAPKDTLLRAALGARASGVHFAAMAELGRNPARIIPAWRDFVDRHAAPGRVLRGVGEPIWPGLSAAELSECHLHESLLNLAFEGTAFWLLCPYDVAHLEPDVVRDAAENHPVLVKRSASRASPTYRGTDGAAAPFALGLPPAPAGAARLRFGAGRLAPVRRFVEQWCATEAVDHEVGATLLLAACELATNSIVHGGGSGTLLLWRDDGSALCEVSDAGHILEPLVGRQRPDVAAEGGRGLWLVNQLCDLVQIRSVAEGTTVRLHVQAA